MRKSLTASLCNSFVNLVDSIFFKLGLNQVLNCMHNLLPNAAKTMNQDNKSQHVLPAKLRQFKI